MTSQLDARTVSLIQMSIARLAPRMDQFSPVFYARLFEQNPRIQHMFRGNLKDQEARLGHMIAVVAQNLDRQAEIEPALRRLGQRHVEYGARDADFAVFGEALMWTLDRFLDDPDPETLDAWREFYNYISELMQVGVAAVIGNTPGTNR